MPPAFVTVHPESRAARWTGVPSAVYKMDMQALALLDKSERDVAIGNILEWMADVDNSDAWAVTPSTFYFATDPQGVGETDDDDDENANGACIGQCFMPIRYAMDGENSRRCLLTCADGAPYEERVITSREWTFYSNKEYYHKGDKRRSKRRSRNEVCHMLMGADAEGEPEAGVYGPVVLSFF